MSKFYSYIKGCRGAATRCGSKSSGIKACAMSYDGSVISSLDYDEKDVLKVRLEIADGSSTYGNCVFSGTLEELKLKLMGGAK